MKVPVIIILMSTMLLSCKSNSQSVKQESNTSVKAEDLKSDDEDFTFEIIKSDAEWKSELTEMEYYVIRDKGTERAFTGDLLDVKAEGTYVCRACALPLFDSKSKFKSGTGWPSFYVGLNENCIVEDTDYDLGYARTEILCSRCGGHLGHVFNDGPKPTGLRYCVNSVSLDFIEAK